VIHGVPPFDPKLIGPQALRSGVLIGRVGQVALNKHGFHVVRASLEGFLYRFFRGFQVFEDVIGIGELEAGLRGFRVQIHGFLEKLERVFDHHVAVFLGKKVGRKLTSLLPEGNAQLEIGFIGIGRDVYRIVEESHARRCITRSEGGLAGTNEEVRIIGIGLQTLLKA
jgi:hypothetical protein